MGHLYHGYVSHNQMVNPRLNAVVQSQLRPQNWCLLLDFSVARLKQRGGLAPAQWQFDDKDWWLEELE
jgi:hypothetical protein